MSLADDAREADVDRLLAAEQAKVADARRERDSAKHALKTMAGELEQMERRMAFLEGVDDLDPKPPKWLAPKKARSGNRAIAYAPGSDWHLDQVVNVDEMNGVNCFDRDIALLRLRRYYEKQVVLARDHLAGITWDGICHPLNGDIFSGDIHEELTDTNAAPLLQSIDFWVEPVAAGILMLAEEFGKVHVPVTVGNHGRRSRKSRMKGRAVDNFDWFFGRTLARMFRDDERVTFQIPESFDLQYDLYDLTVRQEHGDAFKGGSGIAGIWSPIARGHAKRASAAVSTDRPFDLLSIGHFHTLIFGPEWVINGSLVGHDEYAAIMGFSYEPPAQAFAVVTPEHGVTWRAPIFVSDPVKEGWK